MIRMGKWVFTILLNPGLVGDNSNKGGTTDGFCYIEPKLSLMKFLTLTIILLVPCFFCFAQNAPAPEPKTNNPPIDKELLIVEEIKGLGSRAEA